MEVLAASGWMCVCEGEGLRNTHPSPVFGGRVWGEYVDEYVVEILQTVREGVLSPVIHRHPH